MKKVSTKVLSVMKKASLLASVLTLVIVMSCVTMAFAATTPYVESDTTISFTRVQNETYQVKFTVHGTHENPKIAAGNGSVLQTQNVVKTKDSSANDVYYFKVKAIGNPGTTSAIYTTLPGQSAVQHFVITVMKPYVESDTTESFTRPQNETYQVKFTVHGTHENPQITAGNGSVLQTQNVVKTKDSSGNDVYYFKVKAIGNPGTISAIYTNLPGQSAVRHFIITVIKTYPAGMYKVGSDIPAGEYVLMPTGPDMAYFEITTSSDGKPESIVTNDIMYGRSIVTVVVGQYLNVSDAKIYKMDEAPAINKSAKEFAEGMYRVGIDIPAGEFTVVPTDTYGGYYEISSDSSHQVSSIIGSGYIDNTQYLTIESGQYLMLFGAKLIVK